MNPTDTRERILKQMFCDIRLHGFQGLRADRVVADMKITKGALYHYFPNKQTIGWAIIDEFIGPMYIASYKNLKDSDVHPIDGLKAHIQDLVDKATPEDISLGCPLNNLVQEMSPLDETFRQRMKIIVDSINQHIASALQKGQQNGRVSTAIDPQAVAQFVFASIEGSYSLAKVQRNVEAFRTNMNILMNFLESLRLM